MPAVRQELVAEFIRTRQLPVSFQQTVNEHYSRLAGWLARHISAGDCCLLGLNGAQGTGKSTLADFLSEALSGMATVAVLSLDDFYLTRDARKALASDVHPLLATRGVPGTHDLELLRACIAELKTLRPGAATSVPTFDKSTDDRAPSAAWKTVVGPVAAVILEGWCVGSPAQRASELERPVNALEAECDAHGAWRHFVNGQLAGPYAEFFAELRALVFLQTPSFDAVFRWRVEQEQKLAGAKSGGPHLMTKDQIGRFIQHYERITRNDLAVLPDIAEVVLRFGEDHRCVESRYVSG